MKKFRPRARGRSFPIKKSTKKGSITSIQAVYVPADDLTDPAPTTTFAHLDAPKGQSKPFNSILYSYIKILTLKNE